MFMEKSELKNAAQLTKIKLRSIKKDRLGFYLVTLFLLSAGLISAIIRAFSTADGVMEIKLSDYSIIFALVLLLIVTNYACNYKTQNQLYAVYPQTNTSRFLSSQAIDYFYVLITAVTLLLMYFIQYAVFAVIAAFKNNVILVYNFDWHFVISGFFVLIIYVSIIIAFITLFAVLIRKFKIYAILSFVILVALVFAAVPTAPEIFKTILGLLIFESNLALFALKGFVLWIVLFGISFFINMHTVYYKSGINLSKAVITVIIVIGIVAFSTLPVIILRSDFSDTSHSITQINGNADDSYQWKEIVIDASSIPAGSKVNIVAPNITFIYSNVDGAFHFVTYYGENMDMYLELEWDMFEDFNGDKITIQYQLPVLMIDNCEVSKLADATFSARLDGNTLYLDYSYEKNVKAVFIPVWSFMWQFDRFIGKDIFKNHLGTSYGSNYGTVSINVD